MQKSQAADKIDNVRHSLAHLLAMAVLKKYPKAKLGIGPVIHDGFYYDILLKNEGRTTKAGKQAALTAEDLPELENEMRRLVKEELVFKGEKVTPQKARRIFKNQPFKLDLIKEFSRDKKQLTVYYTASPGVAVSLPSQPYTINPIPLFVDLCKGGHVKSTFEINPDAFKLTYIAAAYWRGDEKNPQLTRIYGVAFETKEELEEYIRRQEEAVRRDHKKLGLELDLFTFSDLVGSGLPLWTPKGTIVRNILDDFVWRLRKSKGYLQVDIPHLAKKDLYEKSGHWEKFKDELFKITTREGHLLAMKPMNCPHHTQIFARKQWSYRDLPQRYATTTKVYRDEQSGELAGLSRVRAITQDDAHVFCRRSQVKKEMMAIWDIISEFYGAAGFDLRLRLSLHDPGEPKKYLGTPETWKQAEGELRALVQERGVNASEAVGEAAFYGPKIDFIAKDSLGREWQVATIQLDMNMPERFDLFCINEKGERERIVMVHAAIMGSIERYLSILIEHYAGAFPFWLSPVQVAVLSVTDEAAAYARDVAGDLQKHDIRVIIDDRNETIGRKIREHELQKIPYLLIVGKREAEAHTVSVRERGKGDRGAMGEKEFIKQMASLVNPKP